MFIKVIKNGYIVDAITEPDLQYVKMNQLTSSPVACSEDDEWFGILSSDCSTVFALRDTDGYDPVEIVRFGDPDEYDSIIQNISEQRTVEYEPTDEEVAVNISILRDVIARQQTEELLLLIAQIVDDLSDEDIIKYPNLVEVWQSGQSYDEGKRISYDGVIYKLTKSIKTSSATPDNSPNYQAL